MKPLTVEQVRRAVGGRWLAPSDEATALRVTTDSRDVRPGDLFVALKGPRFDGHAFLAVAAAGGCVGAIVSRHIDLPADIDAAFPGGLIGVSDTTAALGELAAWHRREVTARVIAVTGSNGKTTVKEMIHAVLSRRWRGTRNIKSFNNNIGLPLTLLGVGGEDDYVVCEIGTNAPGEIAALADIAGPDIAVITSIAEAHLEGLGSIEAVAVEKASILSPLGRDGVGIVWADSDLLARATVRYAVRCLSFGLAEGADLRLTAYQSDGRRSRFEVNGRLWVDLPLPGKHNALNALSALAVAREMGMDETEAADALAAMRPVSMRTEWIEAGTVTIINDAYNANPASMRAAGDVLASADGSRRVMIAGDMRELGPRAEQLHQQVGADLARCGVDLLIGVGSLGRYIAKGAADAGLAAEAFDAIGPAAESVCALLDDGDVVLIKGSRAMGMDAVIEPIRSAFAGGGT